jgi:phage antirepressor YoqD-like protein
MTKQDQEYIKENRLKLSMLDMAAHLDISYNRVRNFMIENNLQVDKATVIAIRSKKIKAGETHCRYGRRIF